MEFVKLGDIVEIKKGKKPSLIDKPDGDSIRVIQIDDLRNDDNLKFTNNKTGVYATEDDVLLAWDGANAGTIGYGKTGYIGSTIALLRKKSPEDFSTAFIGKFLQSRFSHLRGKTTGATIPHIDGQVLRSLEIPQIPLPTQRHIASLLSKAEHLIAQRKESIRLLDEYVKAVFVEMFSDSNFPYTKFESVINVQNGQIDPNTHPYLEMLHVGGSNIESITGNLINLKKASEENLISGKYYFTNQHVLYSKIRPYLNKVAIPDFDGICSADIYPILPKPKVLTKHYLRFVLMSKSFLDYAQKQSDRTSIPKINRKALLEFKMPLPNFHLQERFSSIVEKTVSIKCKYIQSLEELENLYGVLSQLAFSGNLPAFE